MPGPQQSIRVWGNRIHLGGFNHRRSRQRKETQAEDQKASGAPNPTTQASGRFYGGCQRTAEETTSNRSQAACLGMADGASDRALGITQSKS